MTESRSHAWVAHGRYKLYNSDNGGERWVSTQQDRKWSRDAVKNIESNTHEISERSDGKWEVMDKSLKPKVYPDKDTMIVALALQGVNVDES